MITLSGKQITILRKIDEFSIRAVKTEEVEIQGAEELELVVKSVYELGDGTLVPEKTMLWFVEKGLLKRSFRHLTEWGKEYLVMLDDQLGE